MKIRHFKQLPKPYLAYPKIIQGLIFKKSQAEPVLPDVQYVVDVLRVDPKHLQAYNEICGFQQDGFIPTMYLAVLSQSLQMHMMTREAFPFPVLGLVHIRNQIQQNRKIGLHETLSLSCEFGDLQPHDKGVQFDFITTAKVGHEVVMQGRTTYLSRQKTSAQVSTKIAEPIHNDYQLQAQWRVSENTGRRYALISGDFNLIHLHAFTAKAFGFKQAIAHGMWSKAKMLASITLPESYEAEVWFKLPLYLPSTVDFLMTQQGAETQFLIRNAQSKKPHVSGIIKAL